MGKTTPYGVLLRVRETKEQHARAALARATRAHQEAEQVVQRMTNELHADHREAGDAQMWAVLDQAHEVKRDALDEARDAFAQAKEALDGAAREHLERKKEHRMVERMSQKQQELQRKQAEKREQRQQDDLTLMRFTREGSGSF